MCGIAGAWSRVPLAEAIASMTASLAHRGPDGEGSWVDGRLPLALGHRRLSVIDTSERGRQPMWSPDGRVIVTYNGEIYNYRGLRADLEAEGLRFASDTDTEVLAAAVSRWGIGRALERCVGMFAFAAWVPGERRLFLARDRIGVKPLYYCWREGRGLLFGSELRALEAGGVPREVDAEAAAEYLAYGYIAAPRSIYASVCKVPAGYWLEFAAGDDGLPREPTASRYWSPPATPPAGGSVRVEEARAEIHRLLRESVGLRLIADVPLGAFLSGGIDSPLVVALMQEASSAPVRTFTIGFAEAGWPDESGRAEAIARHLGTDHTTWVPTGGELRDAAERIPAVFDEPFADSSVIPTSLVSILARRHVTVALSGDGGDEGFLGYDRYAVDEVALRRFGWLARGVPGAGVRLGRRLGVRARLLASLRSPGAFYDWSVGADPGGASLLRPELRDAVTAGAEDESGGGEACDVAAINRRDLLRYLPDDIMVKVDRASMAVGLEAREPLLDHRLIEAALGLPRDLRRPRGGPGKRVLRDILAGYLPLDLIGGPKRGFGAPIGAWLAGPLGHWAADHAAMGDGVLDAGAVGRLWQRWRGGAYGRGEVERLWRALVLRAWLAERGGTVQSARAAAE